MKKIFLINLILSLLVILPVSAISATTAPDEELPPEEVEVRETTNPVEPERKRSLIPAVEVWLLRGSNRVEVIFNRQCGEAGIVITDAAGFPVRSRSFNSTEQPMVSLGIPSDPGEYFIYITSEYYQGSGSFSIN